MAIVTRRAFRAAGLLMLSAAVSAAPPAAAAGLKAGGVGSSIMTVGTNVGSEQIWSDGTVYRLRAAPGRISVIALQPGETLLSVAAGDTARWIIGDTASGEGPETRPHVLVKPVAAGLATNIVIATNRRLYHVELTSDARAPNVGLAWRYPAALIALKGERPAAAAAPVAEGIEPDALEFGYAIEGDRPPWRPVRAFDDGQRLYIEFPRDIAASDLPPLFAVQPGGQAELVNYRVSGRFYRVDRLLAAAELRHGDGRQQVVRILRQDQKARSRRPGRRP